MCVDLPGPLAPSASRYRDLLNAEDSLHTELWTADWWRRIHIEGGLVQPAQTGEEGSMSSMLFNPTDVHPSDLM
jgi:hypothetical protein